ncbi:MAG: hypothetical protein CBC48_14270, partial [bacterium TMED88]
MLEATSPRQGVDSDRIGPIGPGMSPRVPANQTSTATDEGEPMIDAETLDSRKSDRRPIGSMFRGRQTGGTFGLLSRRGAAFASGVVAFQMVF